MLRSKSVQKIPFLAPDVTTKVIPAPIDGWDAISPLAEMDPKRAAILSNWTPRPGWIELRAGYTPLNNIGTKTPVYSLMVWRPATDNGGPTSEKMFAASGSSIYDVSVAGTTPAVVTGLASIQFQYRNFVSGADVTVIQCVNGTDLLWQYDGTSWTQPSITGFPNSWTTANIINIHVQKQRLWYVMKNSTVAVFMPAGAITGPITGTLDLGPFWDKGGALLGMANWTLDGGTGPQDYQAFFSSKGQIAIYTGTDPTSSTTWQLVGVFNVAPPIGLRFTTQVGSDVAIITQQGVIPISQVLPFDPSADRSVALTARIQNAMAQATSMYQGNFGWETITYPNQQLFFLNIPTTPGVISTQYVMNTLTGAWAQFQGWNAQTFALYQNNLYFGDVNGIVQQAYTSSNDGVNPILCEVQCAFNWMDTPGRSKRMTMIQPLMQVSGPLTPNIAIDTDFINNHVIAPIQLLTGTTVWDSAIWDQSTWPAGTITYNSWLSAEAIGHAMAVHMCINLTSLQASNGVFDIGAFDSAVFDSNPSGQNQASLQVNAFNSIVEMGGAI